MDVSSCLQHLGGLGAKYLIALDVVNTYWQLELVEESRECSTHRSQAPAGEVRVDRYFDGPEDVTVHILSSHGVRIERVSQRRPFMVSSRKIPSSCSIRHPSSSLLESILIKNIILYPSTIAERCLEGELKDSIIRQVGRGG